MGTVPIVEGTVESGPIDPSKMSHNDIEVLAEQYQEAVGVISQQRRLIDEANRVIVKLQTMLQELRGETHENRAPRPEDALPAQPSDPVPGENADV